MVASYKSALLMMAPPAVLFDKREAEVLSAMKWMKEIRKGNDRRVGTNLADNLQAAYLVTQRLSRNSAARDK